MSCQVGTIRQIHRRLNDEGFLISEYTLRQWVKTRVLPAVFVGSKALISYTNVLKVLEQDLPPTPAEPPQSKSSLGA